MREKIHPNYMQAHIRCACGNTFETGSTRESLRVDVCNKCHPFFTGEQRIVDTAGRVERFRRRFKLAEEAPATPANQASNSG